MCIKRCAIFTVVVSAVMADESQLPLAEVTMVAIPMGFVYEGGE